MLVLSRKQSEQLLIGEGIIVTVVEIRGDKVRLGIDAPDYLKIWRPEVLERIRKAAAEGNLAEMRDRLDADENRKHL